jgi:predicted membrane-bound spermidine synthase
MAFMLGLSIGGLLSGRLAAGSRKNLLLLEILIILFCLAFLGATTSLAELAGKIVFSVPARLLLLGLSGVSGLLVGAEFSVSSRLVLAGSEDLGKVAGSIYAWDLAGAVVGSLLLSIALVPLLGITVACILVLAVKISSLAIFAASYDLV